MATYGYARVSREDQELALQVDALVAAGVAPGNIVKDKMSGVADRPRFSKLIEKLAKGDTLVTWKVDRLGRSALATMRTFKELDDRGVRVVITTLGMDTGTPTGRLMIGILSQLAEFEREQIIERTNAGLEAAKRRGKKLGRKPLLTCMQARQAAEMVRDGKSYGEIADTMAVSRSVVFKTVRMVNAKAEAAA
jgi:DNA invertase Pin-like site-specific DNA recombinase